MATTTEHKHEHGATVIAHLPLLRFVRETSQGGAEYTGHIPVTKLRQRQGQTETGSAQTHIFLS